MNGLKNRKQAWIAVAACAAVCLALAPAAAAQEVANVRAGSGGIDFEPLVANGGTVLTVSGPEDFHFRAEFTASESPGFSIYDQAGGLLPDGVYHYELSVVPTDAQRRDAFEANQALTKSRGGVEPLIQTGAFSIVNGAVVAGGEIEPGTEGDRVGGNRLATKTTVLTTADGTIINSLCVGSDCTSSESFGFDTLRLKENNTRIDFTDTSNSGSFPTRDWEIEANDSANGGADYLRVEDSDAGTSPFTIEGPAQNNSVWIDSSGNVGGNVGFGTSTPVVDLHVLSGNTPTLRLEQTTASGFAAQTWDVAGNETNFFIRDVTNGSRLPFKIIPSAPTNSLYIANNGNVGVGTASPGATVHVENTGGQDTDDVVITSDGNIGAGTVSPGERLDLHEAGVVRIQLSNTAAGTDWNFSNDGNGDFGILRIGAGGNDFEIEQDGDIGNCGNPDHDFVISTGPGCTVTPRSWIDAGDSGFTTTSSRTLKEHLVPVEAEGIIEKVTAIPVYQYDFIDGPTDRIGLVAEEFHTIFGRGSDKEINSHEMQVAMWLAIQELARENQKLKAEASGKDGTIQALEERLTRLESALSSGE